MNRIEMLKWDLSRIDGAETIPTHIDFGSYSRFILEIEKALGYSINDNPERPVSTFSGVQIVENPDLPDNVVAVMNGKELLNLVFLNDSNGEPKK